MCSIADQIAKLTNPAPDFGDPEAFEDDTKAQLTDKFEEDDGENDDKPFLQATKITKRATSLLADSDVRYAGKQTSRHNFQQMDFEASESEEDVENEEDDSSGINEGSDIDSENEDSDDMNDDEEELADFKNKMDAKTNVIEGNSEFSFVTKGDFSQYADSEEENGIEDADEDGGEEDDDEVEDDEEDVGGMPRFSHSDVGEEVKKGEAVKCQLGLWDNLLEARIKMQKVLSSVNQLPQPAHWLDFSQLMGDDYNKVVTQGQKMIQKLLLQLVHLQTSLLLQNPDTKPLASDESGPVKKSNSTDEEEEITSESEVESEREEDTKTSTQSPLKRKLKMSDVPEFLAKRHKAFLPYRQDTIQKWYDKTRVASGKLGKGFAGFEQSAIRQIDQILSDRDRLVRRTQLKRTAYRVLGKAKEAVTKQTCDEDIDNSSDLLETEAPQIKEQEKNYDEEIFDDDDFYHQLLRELIERKTVETNDPVAITKQWLEIQKLRNKVKRKVDTKASKGRKIRYDIHPKLVNFMAPVDTTIWSEEARNELYKSLFGKAGGQEVTAKPC